MRATTFLLVFLCLTGCTDDQAPPVSNAPGSIPGSESPTTPAPDEPDAQFPDRNPPAETESNEGNVTITRPVEGAVAAANPLMVEGTARTFENNVVIQVLDAESDQIFQTSTTARGELGSFNPWSEEIWITRWPGETLTVRALEHSMKDGSIRSLAAVTLKNGMEQREVSLFFPNTQRSPNDCFQVFKVNHIIPNSVGMARLLTEALIAGPTRFEETQGFSSGFPRGTRVNSIDIDGTTVIVDFSPEMQNVGGSCRVQAIRASLEQTLTQLPNIDRVKITAGGSEELALQP